MCEVYSTFPSTVFQSLSLTTGANGEAEAVRHISELNVTIVFCVTGLGHVLPS